MWLEQTVWLWAPLICAMVLWTIARVTGLAGEVRRLRTRISELEATQNDLAVQSAAARPTRVAA